MNHAPTKRANPKCFRLDLTITITLQEIFSIGHMSQKWHKICFWRCSTSELHWQLTPSTSVHYLLVGVRTKQKRLHGSRTPMDYHVPAPPVSVFPFAQMMSLLNMDPYRLQELFWQIYEIVLCLLKAYARDILPPHPTRPHPPLMDWVCQLVSSHWALFDISPHQGSENLFAVSSSNSSCKRGEADPLQKLLLMLAIGRPLMTDMLENSLSQGENTKGFFRVCWCRAGGRLRPGKGTSWLLDPTHRHCQQEQ